MCGGFWCYKMSELLTVFLLFFIYLLISFFQSGKLVMKMFQKIQELIDDQDALVFVLIDEVRFVHIKLLINSNCKVFFSYFKRKRNWCQYVFQVESLTAARKSTMSGNEPSDAIRVVNALLTQLDQIKRWCILDSASEISHNFVCWYHLLH